MTKKDYKIIARAVRQAKLCAKEYSDTHKTPDHVIECVAHELGLLLLLDNKRFDYDKFQTAINTGKGI